MKAGLPILLCGAFAFPASVLNAAEPGGMRARLLEELRKEFTFQPRPAETDEAKRSLESGGEAVVLPDYHFVETPHDPEPAIREYRGILEREEFSWRHGGTIKNLDRLPFKPALMWKYNPEHDGIDLLRFSW